ncbi:MAG: bifunctional metallophosphatase/5'-nucleotidase, partial [Deltaproteobacteria bacterium]|nr:bifunctional metallophosphatase/5'-nucleotidase [Deltaproteobacteria bacterium]
MKVLRLSVFLAVLFLSVNLFAAEKIISIIHTNDLHSHLLGFSPNIDYRPDRIGNNGTQGGWARVASVIKQEKEKRNNPVLVLDGGDFLMGSLF